MASDRPLDETRPRLGLCPLCGDAIPPDQLLVDYREPDGWPRMLAECPDCTRVVVPQ